MERDRDFAGFAWPVPRAFEAAVAQLRFEVGDVFHRTRAGYGVLEGTPCPTLHAIQVLEAARGSGTDAEAEGGRRSTWDAAWDAELVVERVELASGTRESYRLSQGRLFTALWKGEERWLDPDGPSPDPPRTARDLASSLDVAAAAFDAQGLPARGRSGVRFLFVLDESSSASRAKARLVEEALTGLAASGAPEVRTLDPKEAGVDDEGRFHPTLRIRGIFVDDRSEDELHDALRAVLYGGAGDEAGPDEVADGARTDRFSLARHGRVDVR